MNRWMTRGLVTVGFTTGAWLLTAAPAAADDTPRSTVRAAAAVRVDGAHLLKARVKINLRSDTRLRADVARVQHHAERRSGTTPGLRVRATAHRTAGQPATARRTAGQAVTARGTTALRVNVQRLTGQGTAGAGPRVRVAVRAGHHTPGASAILLGARSTRVHHPSPAVAARAGTGISGATDQVGTVPGGPTGRPAGTAAVVSTAACVALFGPCPSGVTAPDGSAPADPTPPATGGTPPTAGGTPPTAGVSFPSTGLVAAARACLSVSLTGHGGDCAEGTQATVPGSSAPAGTAGGTAGGTPTGAADPQSLGVAASLGVAVDSAAGSAGVNACVAAALGSTSARCNQAQFSEQGSTAGGGTTAGADIGACIGSACGTDGGGAGTSSGGGTGTSTGGSTPGAGSGSGPVPNPGTVNNGAVTGSAGVPGSGAVSAAAEKGGGAGTYRALSGSAAGTVAATPGATGTVALTAAGFADRAPELVTTVLEAGRDQLASTGTSLLTLLLGALMLLLGVLLLLGGRRQSF